MSDIQRILQRISQGSSTEAALRATIHSDYGQFESDLANISPTNTASKRSGSVGCWMSKTTTTKAIEVSRRALFGSRFLRAPSCPLVVRVPGPLVVIAFARVRFLC